MRSFVRLVDYVTKKISIPVLFRRSYPEKMPPVNVRVIPGEERLQISFQYTLTEGKDRVFNVDRSQNEEVGKSLARMSANLSKHLNKKKKKKRQKTENEDQGVSEVEPTISLIKDGSVLPDETPNVLAWLPGTIMRVQETDFNVVINSPTIKSINISDNIMAGFPIVPKIDGEFIDLDKCEFSFFKENKDQEQSSAASNTSENTKWIEIHKGHYYVPSNSDIGHHLKLTCKPSDGNKTGDVVDTVSKNTVSAGPGFCPFEERHLYTEKQSEHGSFRVMTYNLLADFYADSDYSRTVLFPYCPPYALHIDYRRQLLVKEIQGYNCDIICLQEVDRKVFVNDLLPVLSSQGLDGFLKLKMNQTPEGAATFYRKDKFRLLGQHDIDQTTYLQNEPGLQDLLEKVKTNEKLNEKLMSRGSILQVTALESVECADEIAVVATTHLYFHPRAPHIRLLQVQICLHHIQNIVEQYKKQGKRVSVIYCGDFNSSPVHGVMELISKNKISSKHSDWFAMGQEEFVENLELSHTLEFISACGTPDYTNYVGGFIGCLDYIYISPSSLKTTKVVPLPSHEQVTMHTALPSVVFPSDHLALVCDLTWTNWEK